LIWSRLFCEIKSKESIVIKIVDFDLFFDNWIQSIAISKVPKDR